MLLEEGMNIKVCLLPDGDDPDSFARKHNSTEFQQFIQEHETDFIRFKTNLLLEDAGKDPIKRAELIGKSCTKHLGHPRSDCARCVHQRMRPATAGGRQNCWFPKLPKRREMQAEKRAEQAERERRNAGRQAESTQNVTGAESSTPATRQRQTQPQLPPEKFPDTMQMHRSRRKTAIYPLFRKKEKKDRNSINTNRLILQNELCSYGEKSDDAM